MKNIYLDHAATTPVSDSVFMAMKPYFTEVFGNPNSQHGFGRESAKAINSSRDKIASLIGAKTNEIYFTSSGTEADNWAVKGVALANMDKGKHIITTKIEHSAIQASCKQLEKFGFEVTYLGVDSDGFVSPEELESAIRPDTILISVIYASNEIGTVQPIQELCAIAKKNKVLFHTDAVQATGAIDYNVMKLGVDLLSLSAHKFYGPKGIAALYVRSGVKIESFMTGGEQERSKRGGTSNVAGIVGFATALDESLQSLEESKKYVESLRNHFVDRVLAEIDEVLFNGAKDYTKRLPNNASFSFKYIEGESILFSLDIEGIAASSGSACSSGSLEPSKTLLAIGLPVGTAHGSIRFTFGKINTMEDVDFAVDKLKEVVSRLRKMSPLYKKK